MPETPPATTPKTYAHRVPAAVFIEAFTTLHWSAGQTQRFNALGIERITGRALIEKKTGIGVWRLNNEEYYTLLNDVEVIGNIEINNHAQQPPDLVVYQSKLTNIK